MVAEFGVQFSKKQKVLNAEVRKRWKKDRPQLPSKRVIEYVNYFISYILLIISTVIVIVLLIIYLIFWKPIVG